MDILTIIVATLFLSLVLSLILKKINVSPIVGYIFTGMIVTLFVDLVHFDQNVIAHIAEFGIVFLPTTDVLTASRTSKKVARINKCCVFIYVYTSFGIKCVLYVNVNQIRQVYSVKTISYSRLCPYTQGEETTETHTSSL